ncbi:glycoside hydrolase family 47 protein [Dothistroma septosporum NZE10]|uniref:alpha-1,2-Mannosidase n=1 Tax=Dothistroma septosporum (strain NZE10 / CBS 128990) TaxID=675120 RepID=N1PDQ2_DOTSN|nr:glycoside hydrolase family 47 protein [Dothistroma septosporum NZE10]
MRAPGLGLVAALSFQTLASAQNQATSYDNGPAYPKQRGPDYDYTSFPQDQQERADAVIEQFRFAWDGYYQYAYPHDSLQPVNNTYRDDRNGWGLTMVDALDTAVIMEQQDIVDIILKFIPTIDFTKTNAEQNKVLPAATPITTSLFETNIRYLGGILGAYDLLKGPFKHIVKDDQQVDALLKQAVCLADTLKFSFDTPSGIPINMIFIDNQTFTDLDVGDDGIQYAGLAVFGTLVLEWQHLSDLTGDPSYGMLAQKAESNWFNAGEVWPGLTGGLFSVPNGSVVDDYGGWTSGNDSAYEYLIKMYVYDPERYGNYSERWQAAADSTIKHLLSSPNSRPDLTMAGTFAGRVVQNSSEQLACFIGGNFLLGSTIYGRDDYLDAGLKFCEFCANGYRYTASGIGPVLYSWNETILAGANYSNQTNQYERAGWFIDENLAFGGGQTPEAVESWYYAYQTTGDQYWRDVAWAYTVAQNRTLRVGSGFASIKNVYKADGDGTGNYMASFMLAETLKYQFMIQSPKDGEWNVQHGENNKNLFVYNTEAHPFKVASRKPV